MEWVPVRDAAASGGGVTVNVASRAAFLADIAARLDAGQGFSVATLNLDHVAKLRTYPAFHAAYRAMTHVTADGRPIVALSRLAGEPVELVPGSDLITPVVDLAAQKGVPVAMFGSRPSTLEKAAAKLQAVHPGLEVALKLSPSADFDPTGPEADAAIEAIGRSGARICFVALGAPKQEVFSARAQQVLGAVGLLSIGAGLDFIAGDQTRAPYLVRIVWCEWLWRVGTNPRRLAPRYAHCFTLIPGLALSAARLRLSR